MDFYDDLCLSDTPEFGYLFFLTRSSSLDRRISLPVCSVIGIDSIALFLGKRCADLRAFLETTCAFCQTARQSGSSELAEIHSYSASRKTATGVMMCCHLLGNSFMSLTACHKFGY